MKNNQTNLKGQRSVLVYLASGLLIISLVFVTITFFLLARNVQHEQEWMTLATNVQVTSQQLAKSAGESASGNLDAFLELGNSRGKISAAMGKLRVGSASTRLPPTPKAVEVPMKQLTLTWTRMNNNASSILDREKLILELASARNIIQENIPGIQKNTDASIRALIKSDAPTNQIVFASRALVLADRILRRVSEVLQGGSNAVNAAENLGKDRELFDQVLNALLRGNSRLGVTQVRNTKALQSLGRVRSSFETIKPQIQAILNSSSDLFEVRGAADEIFLDSRDVFEEAAGLKSAIAEIPQSRIWPSQAAGALGLLVMIAVVWILVYSFLSAERRRAKIAARSNKKNQEAILQLLDEMTRKLPAQRWRRAV